MLLEMILGGIEADRTAACFDKMEQLRCDHPDMRMIMIVPDQYSYTAERRMAQRFGGAGLNGIEVLTFGRLAYRVRGEIMPPDYLTPAGKQMLLRRAVAITEDKDDVFTLCRGKRGFMDTLAQLISEFKRYSVTADMLAAHAGEIKNDMLRRKMKVIADIYMNYETLLKGKFTDSDDDMDLVAEYILSAGFLDGYAVWFDEFSDFLPQNYRVIEAIMSRASYVGVTLCIPTDGAYRPDDDTYDTCRATYAKLKRIARENGCPAADVCAANVRAGTTSPELSFLTSYWSSVREVYSKETDKITLFQGRDLYSEVTYTAEEITRLVSEGMRYRDISVLCGDLGEYRHLIEAVFPDYGIPYFSDSTAAVTTHPVIALLLSLFHILSFHWRYDDVFRYLRTGMIYEPHGNSFVPLDETMVDRLENYVLQYGVRGDRQWLSEEEWQDAPTELFGDAIGMEAAENRMRIDAFRRAVVRPIATFKEACAGKKTFRKIAEALYAFLEDICLPDGLRLQIREFSEQGKENEAQQYERIWALLIEAMDQIVETLGEETCTLEEFGQYLEDGLSCCDIRIIPSASDAVTIGTVERSRTSDVRALFLIGANSGKLPHEMHTEGILSDYDRHMLEEMDILLAPDTRTKNTAEEFKLFQAISHARERLYVTYALADREDRALRPAQLVFDLRRRFPHLRYRNDDCGESETIVPSQKAVFGKLMHHMREESWQPVKEWYRSSEEWKRRLARIEQTQRMKAEISEEIAVDLYGARRAQSITRFENYARCPYGYFLTYGLRARPREEWKIRKLDIGNLCHYLVQSYCSRISGDAQTLTEARERWMKLTPEQSAAEVSALCEEAKEKTIKKLVHDAGRVESILRRVRRSVTASVDIINRSLQNGGYTVAACEKEFSCTLGGNMQVRGIIDRVDIMERGGKAYLRIIDYKTGSKEFDPTNVYDKLDLQLAVYAASAVELYHSGGFAPLQNDEITDAEVKGMFYEKIHDTIETEEDAGARGKMTGIIFADTDEEVQTMDCTMAEKEESAFLNLRYNQYGKLSGDIHTPEDTAVLEEYAVRAVKEIERDIYRGKINIHPYRRASSTACSYCPYGEICLFDPSVHDYRMLLSGRTRRKDAWDKMRDIIKGGK